MANMRTVIKDKLRNNAKSDDKHLTYLYLLDYIKKTVKVESITLESNIRLEYVADFYGLLKYINTNDKLNYINLLLNNLESSHEYDGMQDVVYIIDETDSRISSIMERLNGKISLG